MANTNTPLIHPRLLRERLTSFQLPTNWDTQHQLIQRWIKNLKDGTLDEQNEITLHGAFLAEIFGTILGYRGITQKDDAGSWEISAEKSMGRGRADAALGFFWQNHSTVLAPIELKGTKQSLDLAKGRAQTPVQQGWEYANHNKSCRWIIVSNYRETRLYSTTQTPEVYERFLLEDLADINHCKRFLFLLSRAQLLPARLDEKAPLDELLTASAKVEKEITDEFYQEYSKLRTQLYQFLCKAHSNQSPLDLIKYTEDLRPHLVRRLRRRPRPLTPRHHQESLSLL